MVGYAHNLLFSNLINLGLEFNNAFQLIYSLIM